MKISKISMYAPSFGQVRKSAAQRAIREASDNFIRLNEIKALVDSQKDNDKIDIIEHKGPIGNKLGYSVVARGEEHGISYEDLETACVEATVQKANLEAWNEYIKFSTPCATSADCKRLADEILAGCED